MSRPLHGRAIVVTRPVAQATELCDRLTALGAKVIELPLTWIAPLARTPEIEAALARLKEYDVIVVTSANGAACFADQLVAAGVRPRPGVVMVAVGTATATALRARGFRVDLVPERATGDAIVGVLASRDLTGRRVLLPRARQARPELPAGLRAAGGIVDDVAFYETVRAALRPEAVARALAADDILLTAPSGVAALLDAVDSRQLAALRLITIGPTTSDAVRQAGLDVAAEASEQSAEGLVTALRSVTDK